MLTRLLCFVLVAAAVFALLALAPSRGFIGAASGTSTITRNFQYPVKQLFIVPATQDVNVILVPAYAQDDTFTCRANDVNQFDGGYDAIYGFILLRPVATAVDIRWQ